MWLLLLVLLGLGSCFFITLIFGLLKAGRRADEGEERILKLILPPTPSQDATADEDIPNGQK